MSVLAPKEVCWSPVKNIPRIKIFSPPPGTPVKKVAKAGKDLDFLGMNAFLFFAQNNHHIPAHWEEEKLFFMEGATAYRGEMVAPCMKKTAGGWDFSHREIIPEIWDEGHAALYLEPLQ